MTENKWNADATTIIVSQKGTGALSASSAPLKSNRFVYHSRYSEFVGEVVRS
jgi:hypothetical protein